MNAFEHRTKISGYLTVLSSAAYLGFPVLQTVISPRAFAIATFSLGVLTALIGHFNTSEQKALEARLQAERNFQEGLARDHEGEDESHE